MTYTDVAIDFARRHGLVLYFRRESGQALFTTEDTHLVSVAWGATQDEAMKNLIGSTHAVEPTQTTITPLVWGEPLFFPENLEERLERLVSEAVEYMCEMYSHKVALAVLEDEGFVACRWGDKWEVGSECTDTPEIDFAQRVVEIGAKMSAKVDEAKESSRQAIKALEQYLA